MFQSENPFTILGIDATATTDEIAAAWKTKVKKLHPDRYPEAPAEILAKLTEEISRVNAAHDLLKNDLEGMRRIYGQSKPQNENIRSDSETSYSRHRESARQRTISHNCEICGSLNTDTFSFTRQVGLIFQRRVGTFTALLCKNCALALGREYQSRTITAGWWGSISFFANFLYIGKNTLELMKAQKLDNPKAPAGFRTTPLDPGKNIAQRPFTWIGPIVIAVIIGVAGSNSESGSNYTPSPNSVATYDWSIGNCISFGTYVRPIACGVPHSGKIIASASFSQGCPFGTDASVDVNGRIYCIDEDL